MSWQHAAAFGTRRGCLNPYYTGSYSMSKAEDARIIDLSEVLILIILEVTL